MFRTAAAAGWTPETRYKTSFYSMLGGDGQTEGWGGQIVRRGRPFSNVGGRQIDRDMAGRNVVAAVLQGGAHRSRLFRTAASGNPTV